MAESKSNEVSIQASENGPYIVKQLETLTNSKGESIQTRKTIALCRCGQSANKPFCDGTHAQLGFSSAKVADGSLDKRDEYAGKTITIYDNRGICAHAGKCTDALPQVWKMGVEPWIDAQGADPNAIIEAVKQCPSGALSYSIDDVEHRDEERQPQITVTRNGPYAVTGGVDLVDEPKG